MLDKYAGLGSPDPYLYTRLIFPLVLFLNSSTLNSLDLRLSFWLHSNTFLLFKLKNRPIYNYILATNSKKWKYIELKGEGLYSALYGSVNLGCLPRLINSPTCRWGCSILPLGQGMSKWPRLRLPLMLHALDTVIAAGWPKQVQSPLLWDRKIRVGWGTGSFHWNC